MWRVCVDGLLILCPALDMTKRSLAITLLPGNIVFIVDLDSGNSRPDIQDAYRMGWGQGGNIYYGDARPW